MYLNQSSFLSLLLFYFILFYSILSIYLFILFFIYFHLYIFYIFLFLCIGSSDLAPGAAVRNYSFYLCV